MKTRLDRFISKDGPTKGTLLFYSGLRVSRARRDPDLDVALAALAEHRQLQDLLANLKLPPGV
jgi:hypothetical protein